jgi:hypothetical protein
MSIDVAANRVGGTAMQAPESARCCSGTPLAAASTMRFALPIALVACSTTAGRPNLPPTITQRFSNDLDVLFVIDNSASTADKQTVFAANFPRLVQALDAFPGGRPNLHVGVVDTTVDIGVQGMGPGCPSPDPNDNGLLQNTPRVTGCSGPTGRFLSDVADATGGRTTNYLGTLEAAFSCIAQVGASGCGYEAPLEAMKRALDGSRPENAGFLRQDANLFVVILTDEDDCSVQDPSLFSLSNVGPGDFRCQPLFAYDCDQPISATDPGTYTGCKPALGSYLRDPKFYIDFLHSVVSEQRLSVAIIDGDAPLGADGLWTFSTGAITTPFQQSLALEPSCMATINGNPTIARPGIRLASFAEQLGTKARQYSICQPDYSGVLTDVGALMKQAMQPCIAGAVDATDLDPANPGIQPNCSVTVAAAGNYELLPACAMADDSTPAPGASGCVYFVADPTCGTASNLAVHVLTTIPFGDTLTVSCNP